jgi:UDP-N-acetylmuramoyl-L-alanyl-D-glutamate--2,6-diaminopimelate ligase
MFKEGILDTILRTIRKLMPKRVFSFFAPFYHILLAYGGAIIYGFPSRKLKVIGVTGTKGKSTTVYFISKILEAAGHSVAAIGSLGYKIRDREWPNTLKMSMPGRFKLQKFLRQAVKAGCEYVVLEVTSEGIAQKRHLGIAFDCAVFTNIHREHLESHGSFDNYLAAKQELFQHTKHMHVINADDAHASAFGDFSAARKIFYGIDRGDIRATNITVRGTSASFEVYGTQFSLAVGGEFNVLNALAALATVALYGVDLPTAQPILANIKHVPGRMDWVRREPFGAVVDYAHTPDSLEAVYRTLRMELERTDCGGKLICVLGSCGGGRDRWKRPEFGRIASTYGDEIILTNEDPYDEGPQAIIEEVRAGISSEKASVTHVVIDRREAIHRALTDAQKGDIVIITGKGSETSMALANGKKIPWSDRGIVEEFLARRKK